MKDIQLRAIEPGDIDVIYKWENDQEIWESSETHIPFSKYTLEQYIISTQNMDIQSSKQLRLMVDLKQNDNEVTVACVDIFDYNMFNKRAGVGILVDKKYRGKGIASSAIAKVCDYCKKHLYLHSIYVNIREDNIASIKVFENNEFELIGVKKDWIYDGEKFYNEYLLQKIL